mmetsp:Transcript_96439/g.152537  ORF Transcript_96439/g.152537 Transcript_96439/m.152537 type:complete len:151 (-) Transcript_96439:2109-2561(-)
MNLSVRARRRKVWQRQSARSYASNFEHVLCRASARRFTISNQALITTSCSKHCAASLCQATYFLRSSGNGKVPSGFKHLLVASLTVFLRCPVLSGSRFTPEYVANLSMHWESIENTLGTVALVCLTSLTCMSAPIAPPPVPSYDASRNFT